MLNALRDCGITRIDAHPCTARNSTGFHVRSLSVIRYAADKRQSIDGRDMKN